MRLVLAVDSAVGVDAKELAAVWAADGEASILGPASVEAPSSASFPAGLLEVVVVPLVVSLGSVALRDLLRRLVRRARPAGDPLDLELTEITTAHGHRMVVLSPGRQR